MVTVGTARLRLEYSSRLPETGPAALYALHESKSLDMAPESAPAKGQTAAYRQRMH